MEPDRNSSLPSGAVSVGFEVYALRVGKRRCAEAMAFAMVCTYSVIITEDKVPGQICTILPQAMFFVDLAV